MIAPSSAPLRRDWLYWLLAAYAGLHLVWIGALLVDFAVAPWAPDAVYGSPGWRLLQMLLLTPVALGVAALVLRRAPGNIVGLCLLLWSASLLAAATLRADSPLLPYNALNTGWVGLWLLAIYFPDGRAQPARLAGLVRGLTALLVVLSIVSVFVTPTQQSAGRTDLVNQLAVPALAPLGPLVALLYVPALGGTVLLILPSLLLRYRASGLHIRQQLKWLIWGFGMLLASLILLGPLGFFSTTPGRLTGVSRWVEMAFSIIMTLFPYLTVGYAILRHRLYDIDIIIRRTLVYGVLSGLLTLLYFGSVVVIESLLRGVVGGGSQAAIVLSTLIIAALFGPLRGRVQRVIDRRFYRRKYDAARTLAAFSASVRDDVDLDALGQRLTAVVDETMQPAHIRLWTPGKPQRPAPPKAHP